MSSEIFDGIIISYPKLKDRLNLKKVKEEGFTFDAAFYEGVINSHAAPNVLYIHDLAAKKYFFPNSRLEEILGHPKKTLQSMSYEMLRSLMHPDDYRKYDLFTNKVSASRTDDFFESEYRLKGKNGRWRWFLSKERIYKFDNDTNVSHIFGIATDITKLKATEAKTRESSVRMLMAEKKFRDIFEHSPDAIFIEDISGTILDINKAASVMQDLPKENLIGMSIRELVPPDKYVRVLRDYKQLFFGIVRTVESSVWRKDGEVPVEISGKKILYENKPALLLQVRDITERKKIEAERAHILMEKSRQKEEMIRTSMKIQEEERNRIAEEMHDEIGAGLSKISVLSEVIKKSTGNSSLVACTINKIIDSSKEVQQNISEIIWAMDPQNDSLENLISYLRYYASEFFESSSIDFSITIPEKIPLVTLIGKLRRQTFLIVKEALNNILKHSCATHAGFQIGFENNILSFIISDNGKGFDIVRVPRFRNGMNNMKRRMSEMEGKLHIVSSEGEGTTIRIEIPVQSSDTQVTILHLGLFPESLLKKHV